MAYETIKAGILEGKLISGENYSELDLAKSLGGEGGPEKEREGKEGLDEHKAIVKAISQGDGKNERSHQNSYDQQQVGRLGMSPVNKGHHAKKGDNQHGETRD